MHHLLEAVETSYLDESDLARVDPDGHALIDVNTPEDLTRADELLLGARGPGAR